MKKSFQLDPDQTTENPCLVIEMGQKDGCMTMSIAIIATNSALFLKDIKFKQSLIKVLVALSKPEVDQRVIGLDVLLKDQLVNICGFYTKEDVSAYLANQKKSPSKIKLSSTDPRILSLFLDIAKYIDNTIIWHYLKQTDYISLLKED